LGVLSSRGYQPDSLNCLAETFKISHHITLFLKTENMYRWMDIHTHTHTLSLSLTHSSQLYTRLPHEYILHYATHKNKVVTTPEHHSKTGVVKVKLCTCLDIIRWRQVISFVLQ
jgi:hypothetical protein